MRNTITLALLCLCLLASSCKKDASTPGSPSFTWTYLGASFTATTITATKPGPIPGGGGGYEHTYDLVAVAQGGTAWVKLSDIGVGTHTDAGYSNRFEYGTGDLSPFVVTVSSGSDSTISGSFSGTYNGDQITGSFANITYR